MLGKKLEGQFFSIPGCPGPLKGRSLFAAATRDGDQTSAEDECHFLPMDRRKQIQK